jgi:hypothetical protein
MSHNSIRIVTPGIKMTWYNILLLFLIILIPLIYFSIMLELYLRKSLIFKSYSRPSSETPSFQPLGKITPLTEEEKITKNNIIFCNLYPDDCQQES